MASTLFEASTRSNPASVMTTELDALASGSAAIATTAQDNDLGDLYADAELTVDFVSAPTADGMIDLYLVRTVDGTNYEDSTTGGTERPPKNGYVGSFFVANTTAAQRLVIPEIWLPPRDFKPFIVNLTSQAFPASGSILKFFYYRLKSS
jgi:hypothetical protein